MQKNLLKKFLISSLWLILVIQFILVVNRPIIAQLSSNHLVDLQVLPVYPFSAPLPNRECLDSSSESGCYLVLLNIDQGYKVDYNREYRNLPASTQAELYIEQYGQIFAVVIPGDGLLLSFMREGEDEELKFHRFPEMATGGIYYFRAHIIDLLAPEFLIPVPEAVIIKTKRGRIIEGVLISETAINYVVQIDETNMVLHKSQIEEFHFLSDGNDLSHLLNNYEVPEYAYYLSAGGASIFSISYEYRFRENSSLSGSIGSLGHQGRTEIGLAGHMLHRLGQHKAETTAGLVFHQVKPNNWENVQYIRPILYAGYRYETRKDILFRAGISTSSSYNFRNSSTDTDLKLQISFGYNF